MLLPNLQLQGTGLNDHMKGNTYFPMTTWHSFSASSHFCQTSSSFVWKQCAHSLQSGHSTDTSSPFPYHWLYPRAPCSSCGRKILLHLTARELSNLPKVTEKMRVISTGTCTVVFGGSAESFKTQLSSHPSLWNEKLFLNPSEHSHYVYKLLFNSLLHLKALTNPSH